MATVVFDSVTKRYGDVTAVDDLNLEVADGEFMVLLGPSGCGKTTALRMVAGFEDISEGTLSIGGRVVNHVEPAKRDISMVFQSYALYPHMSVRHNIESPLLVRKYAVDGPGRPPRKLTKAERHERVTDAAGVLELGQYLSRKPRALSGGQRQRVALARAMVTRPQAFLMDEPLSNLDAKLRSQTRRELVDLHRESEGTVIYVTHDQVEAMTMATRIAIMSHAQLQQVGTPEEVYSRPANLFVAQFIGTPPMNCVPATFTSDGGPAAVAGDSRFPVPSDLTTRLEEGQDVVAGTRPEDLVSLSGGPIRPRVQGFEWLGHERLVFGEVEGHRLVSRQSGTESPPAGDGIELTIDPAHVHLFDPRTTRRLT
jgi:multiple sugar transport system ATP-binding protein